MMALLLPEFPAFTRRPAMAGVCLLCRLIFGGVFVFSGLIKLADPTAFLFDIRSFQILSDPWAAYVALGLPWLELLCASAILLGPGRRGGLAILLGSLAVFLAAILYSWHRGLDISCGCFGKQAGASNYMELILRDLAIIAAGAWVAWSLPRLAKS